MSALLLKMSSSFKKSNNTTKQNINPGKEILSMITVYIHSLTHDTL